MVKAGGPVALKAAKALGPLGLLLSFGMASAQAAEAQSQGNSAQAKEIMSLWAADAAGSGLGEVMGATLGGIALAAVAAIGVAVSAPVAGAVLIGAALIGGIFGADGATKVYEMTKDLDENGRMDLLDKLGNLLFGVNYTVTSPLPADLNGQRLTLDATYSRADIVALAKENIAWRYALRELNPFVITDIAYDRHNTDGSLNLYDPATGQGAMTEAYLADRAAMLTWKIRFDRGMQDDNDAAHDGPKSYTEDWDTNAVQGNWDFVDLDPSTRLPGGDPLTLAIDGQGITLHDHQVVFGSHASESIEGAGDSDRLYGGAGNDSLNGNDGNDYLEGNGGDDVLLGGSDTSRGNRDWLVGGTGRDRYVFEGDFGNDVVFDSDGIGSITINGATVVGGTQTDPTTAVIKDRQTNADLFGWGNRLFIALGDGFYSNTITVLNWKNGDLGIRLRPYIGPPPDPNIQSPIVLDLDGDGVETLGLASGIHFDHDGNEFSELSGWVGADDGLLVRDLNRVGVIETGNELFGANTRLSNGQFARNGFEALKEYDANADGMISGGELQSLSVWRDINKNGATDDGELQSASRAGVQSISTIYSNSRVVDANGNEHRQMGSYVSTSGVTRTAVDVWFATNALDSESKPLSQSIPADVLSLPNLEGYGNTRSLHEGMATNVRLKRLVESFVGEKDEVSRAVLMRDILWEWTGVAERESGSRGRYLSEARWLYMVEAMFANSYEQDGWGANPGPYASDLIQQLSNQIFERLYAQLMAQTHVQSAFAAADVSFDAANKIFVVDYSGVVSMIAEMAHESRSDALTMLGNFMRALRGQDALSSNGLVQLEQGLASLGPEFTTVVHRKFVQEGLGLTSPNPFGQFLLYGTAFDDVLIGGDADDSLHGGVGNDDLIGLSGNDQLTGGAGDDRLYGGSGSNVYMFNIGDGQDTIFGESDSLLFDTLKLNVAQSSIVLDRIGDHLRISLTGTESGVVWNNFFRGVDGIDGVVSLNQKTIEFSDGSAWDCDYIIQKFSISTESDDLLWGENSSDVLNGVGGDDIIFGRGGDDSLFGGAGSDFIKGGDGRDDLQGGGRMIN